MMNKELKKLVPFFFTGGIVGAKGQEVVEGVEESIPSTGVDVGAKIADEYQALSGRLNELAETPEGQQAANSLLEWIEKAEMFHLPWINWVLVAAGVALFGSHVGQLVLGKLWVGIRGGGWNATETFNDLLVAGFALLALPVVMTIPIGMEALIDRPLAIISSVLVGVVCALILYIHGVRQERFASEGEKVLGKEARASS